jgi:hypothetical protein
MATFTKDQIAEYFLQHSHIPTGDMTITSPVGEEKEIAEEGDGFFCTIGDYAYITGRVVCGKLNFRSEEA